MKIDEALPSAQTVRAALPPEHSIPEYIANGLRVIWKALTLNRKVAIGSGMVAFFILVAIFGPMFPLQNPNAVSHAYHAAPSAAHWLGTSTTGQDLFSQLVYGTRSTVFWGLLTGLLVTVFSILIGLTGAYLGGTVDEILSLLSNVFLMIPGLPLAIVLAAYFPRGPLTISLVILVVSWAWGARVLRAQTLSMRSREFVTAARASGETTWRIIFYEILPNEISIVAAQFVTTTIAVILAWAALEFLGLGDPSAVSWGSMLYWAEQADALFSGLWWWFVPPGLCIALFGAGLALINFGIDEISDPRLRSLRTIRKIEKMQERSTSHLDG
jgi:peptide/nickel transport system permease protein